MLLHTYLFKTGKILTTQSTDFGYSFVSFFPRRIIRAAERFLCCVTVVWLFVSCYPGKVSGRLNMVRVIWLDSFYKSTLIQMSLYRGTILVLLVIGPKSTENVHPLVECWCVYLLYGLILSVYLILFHSNLHFQAGQSASCDDGAHCHHKLCKWQDVEMYTFHRLYINNGYSHGYVIHWLGPSQ